MKKTFIGSFPTQERLVSKILELKNDGVDEQDMIIVMKDDKAIAELRDKAEKDRDNSPFFLFDRPMQFLVGEENVRNMLHDSGFTDVEAKTYFHAVQEGALLLYVNGKYENTRNVDLQAEEKRYDGYEPIPLDESEVGLDN